MVPFLSDSLEELLRSLMKVVVKQEVLEEASTALSLTKIEVRGRTSQIGNSSKAITFFDGK